MSLYERVLGEDFARLPRALRELHGVDRVATFGGEANVEAGAGWIAALLRAVIGFPAAGERIPLRVRIECVGGSERWTREFGARRFHSVLTAPADGARGEIVERFGLLRFRLRLPVGDGGLGMPLLRAYAFGIPLPRALTPRSETREFEDAQQRFCFDVRIRLPWGAPLVRYAGWLRRATD